MRPENLLIVADSERDADLLYATKMFVGDPFIFLRIKGQKYIVMSDLEIDRARKQAPECQVISWTDCQQRLREQGGTKNGFAKVIALLLHDHRLKKITVPGNFPLGLARELEQLGIRLAVKAVGIFPERETKSAEEVRLISAASRMAETGLAEGIRALRSSKISKDKKIIYRGTPLTSEKLRSIIDTAVLQAGGLASHTIVAGGKQGCDPHERGTGILRAHETLILDVFPRAQKSGYHGDITRTVVKGRASEAIHKLYKTVARGQEIAFSKIKDGASGKEIHEAIQKMFVESGYTTGRRNGRMEGFFHGTGHGLGLEVHEAPRISALSDNALTTGHVVTVEPGLYYEKMGSVRLEDVVLVTAKGNKNLTRVEKGLEV